MLGLLVIRYDECRLCGGRCFDQACDGLQYVRNDLCAIPRLADVYDSHWMTGRRYCGKFPLILFLRPVRCRSFRRLGDRTASSLASRDCILGSCARKCLELGAEIQSVSYSYREDQIAALTCSINACRRMCRERRHWKLFIGRRLERMFIV